MPPPTLSPRQHDIVTRLVAGESVLQIARALGIDKASVYFHLRQPEVQDAIADAMEEVRGRVVAFKLRAVSGAEQALDKLISLGENGSTEELQRLASLDVVRISGLMPRKRVLLQNETTHGIDADTRDWFASVLTETRAPRSLESDKS